MKAFDTCSSCTRKHSWREIDYENMLYASVENAICLTLCPVCTEKFLATPHDELSILNYKQKITNLLKGILQKT